MRLARQRKNLSYLRAHFFFASFTGRLVVEVYAGAVMKWEKWTWEKMGVHPGALEGGVASRVRFETTLAKTPLGPLERWGRITERGVFGARGSSPLSAVRISNDRGGPQRRF